MTLVMLAVTDERVQLWTDTLVTAERDGRRGPHCFTTKFTVLAHADALITGVGNWDLGFEWTAIAMQTPAATILDLDAIAPAKLRAIWRYLCENITERDLSLERSVIFVVGRTACGAYTAFAYDSKNDFESDRLRHGTLVIEPAPGFDIGPAPASAKDCVALARRLHDDNWHMLELGQDRDADGHRTGGIEIGGDLVVAEMHDGIIEIGKTHRFDTHHSHLAQMDP